MTRILLVRACLAFAVGFAACDAGPGTSADAAVDARAVGCENDTPPPYICGGELCGNNRIDTCARGSIDPRTGCTRYVPVMETCDGTNTSTCADRGFFGGETRCLTCQILDDSDCEACAPGTLGCESVAAPRVGDPIVASGSHVALRTQDGFIRIFDGLTLVATSAPNTYANSIAAVPNGWLIQPQVGQIATLGFDGTVGTPLVSQNKLHMVHGPGGRVIAAFTQQLSSNDPWTVDAAIRDVTGAVIVPPFTLFESERQPAVTTDGTSFFVGSKGQLARVAADGTFTVTQGFPTDPTVIGETVGLTWSGTIGWYITVRGSPYRVDAQRFDASGAPIGAALALSEVQFEGLIADGDGLLAVRVRTTGSSPPGARIELVRIDATGTLGTAVPIGAGDGYPAYADRLGSELVVAWTRTIGDVRMARVSP